MLYTYMLTRGSYKIHMRPKSCLEACELYVSCLQRFLSHLHELAHSLSRKRCSSPCTRHLSLFSLTWTSISPPTILANTYTSPLTSYRITTTKHD